MKNNKESIICKRILPLTMEQINSFEYSDEPISISYLVELINKNSKNSKNYKFKCEHLIDWMIEKELLYRPKNKTASLPTEKGLMIGISNIPYKNNNYISHKNVYNKDAQKFILENYQIDQMKIANQITLITRGGERLKYSYTDDELKNINQLLTPIDKAKNKGVQIWQNKIEKNKKKAKNIAEKQQGIICFIDFKCHEFGRISGKWSHLGVLYNQGLQINNRVYFEDGAYKLVSGRDAKVIKKYNVIPDWANEFLIDKYNNAMGKRKSIDE